MNNWIVHLHRIFISKVWSRDRYNRTFLSLIGQILFWTFLSLIGQIPFLSLIGQILFWTFLSLIGQILFWVWGDFDRANTFLGVRWFWRCVSDKLTNKKNYCFGICHEIPRVAGKLSNKKIIFKFQKGFVMSFKFLLYVFYFRVLLIF
jgi:hypothetical protein